MSGCIIFSLKVALTFCLTGLLASLSGGCAPPCRPNTVLVSLTFGEDLKAPLAHADRITVRVGSNQSVPTTLPALLHSGIHLEVDLKEHYASGQAVDLNAWAWQGATPLATGSTHLEH